MADDWYFKSDSTQHGPISFESLRELAARKALRPNDTVRQGTEGAWRFADSVRHLFPTRNFESAAPNESDDSRSNEPASNAVECFTLDSELCHYKLNGREHGPIALDELRHLAAVSGETAREIVVRRNENDAWQPLESFENLPRKSEHSSTLEFNSGDAATSKGLAAETSSPKSAGAIRQQSVTERVIARIRRNRDLAVAALLLVALNAILLAAMKSPLAPERRYFESLRSIDSELRSLEAVKTSPDQWSDFRERADALLVPMIKDLEKSADVAHPIRQHLLWAGRDNLADLISSAGKTASVQPELNEERLLFEQHMKWLETAFAEQGE